MQDAHLYSELLKLAEALELPSGGFSEIADAKTRIVTALGAIGVGGGGGGLPTGLTYTSNVLKVGSNLANSLNLSGSATGQPVTISATGSDADIDVAVFPQGPEGQFTIGSRAGLAAFNASSGFGAIHQQEGTYAAFFQRSATLDGSGGTYYEGYSHRGTLAIPLASQTNDILSAYAMLGYGVTDFLFGGEMVWSAAENWDDTHTGTKFYIGATKTGFPSTGGGFINVVEFTGLKTLLGGTEPTAIPAFTSNGFVKTSGSDGTLSVDTTAYQTALVNSAGLLAALSDETGTGLAVFNTSPTIITPTIARLANLATDGFTKTSGGNGTLGVQANGLSETIVIAGLISITTVNGIITAHA